MNEKQKIFFNFMSGCEFAIPKDFYDIKALIFGEFEVMDLFRLDIDIIKEYYNEQEIDFDEDNYFDESNHGIVYKEFYDFVKEASKNLIEAWEARLTIYHEQIYYDFETFAWLSLSEVATNEMIKNAEHGNFNINKDRNTNQWERLANKHSNHTF